MDYYGPTVYYLNDGFTSEFNTVQLSVKFNKKSVDYQVLKSTISNLNSEVVKVFVHAPCDGAYASNKTPYLLSRSRRTVLEILDCDRRVDGVILHYGSNGIDNLRKFFENSRTRTPRLLMENSAGQGNTMGVTEDNLRKFYEEFPECGLCIDTQHSFASSLIDFRDSSSMLEQLDVIKSIHKIDLIHLNDSKVAWNSRRDSHADIGTGMIWKKDLKPLVSLISYMRSESIPSVLETNDPIGDCHYIKDTLIGLA